MFNPGMLAGSPGKDPGMMQMEERSHHCEISEVPREKAPLQGKDIPRALSQWMLRGRHPTPAPSGLPVSPKGNLFLILETFVKVLTHRHKRTKI